MYCYHLPTDLSEVKDYSGVLMQKIHHRVHRQCGIILLYLSILNIQSETLTIHLVKHTAKKTSNMRQRYLFSAEDFWFLQNIPVLKRIVGLAGRALDLQKNCVFSLIQQILNCSVIDAAEKKIYNGPFHNFVFVPAI